MMTAEHTDKTPGVLKKFMFDTEFGVDDEPDADESIVQETQSQEAEPEEEVILEPKFVEELAPTFTEQELAQAREEGQNAGREAAIKDMTTALEQQMLLTLGDINKKVTRLFEEYAHDTQEHQQNAISVATVIVRKLFPALNMKNSMAEIEHIIAEAMQRTSRAPSLLIKVPTKIHQAVEEKVAEMAALKGRSGQINVMPDADLSDGNLAVEWEGGGILRDTTVMWEQIDTIIERNLGTSLSDQTSQSATGKNDHPTDEAEKNAQNEATENEALTKEQKPEQQAQENKNEEKSANSPMIDDIEHGEHPTPNTQSNVTEPEG